MNYTSFFFYFLFVECTKGDRRREIYELVYGIKFLKSHLLEFGNGLFRLLSKDSNVFNSIHPRFKSIVCSRHPAKLSSYINAISGYSAQAVYSSRDSLLCFSLISTESSLRTSNNLISTFTSTYQEDHITASIPDVFKVSQSLLDIFLNKLDCLQRSSRCPFYSLLEFNKLEIEFGLGIRTVGITSGDLERTVEQLQDNIYLPLSHFYRISLRMKNISKFYLTVYELFSVVFANKNHEYLSLFSNKLVSCLCNYSSLTYDIDYRVVLVENILQLTPSESFLPPDLQSRRNSSHLLDDSTKTTNNDSGLYDDAKYLCFSILVMSIIDIDVVYSINTLLPPLPSNVFAVPTVQSGSPSDQRVFQNIGLTGRNVVIGVADTGLDRRSCYFAEDDTSDVTPDSPIDNVRSEPSRRKVVSYVAYMDGTDGSGHGTHVCGTIAGRVVTDSENVYTSYDGMAPDSKIAFVDVEMTGEKYLKIPNLYRYLFPSAMAAGAVIHSNSWGTSSSAYCTSWCTDVDSFMEDHPYFLVLFAAGNDGTAISVPAMAKNPISVGATGTSHGSSGGWGSMDEIPSWSGRGPTWDGRFGVDCVAPGSYVRSARASSDGASDSCDTAPMYGTSMATPLAAGAAALIYQYFSDPTFYASLCQETYLYCHSFEPSAALMKAVLLHSGQDVGNGCESYCKWPGPEQGFGRIDLDSVLYHPTVAKETFDLFVEEFTLNSYESKYYLISFASTNRLENSSDSTESHKSDSNRQKMSIKITISWIDPASPSNAAKQLLHDIDLKAKVVDSERLYLGNGWSKPDEFNTVEMINIKDFSSSSSQVIIQIHSPSFLAGNSLHNQKVAIVITCPGSGTVTAVSSYPPLDGESSPIEGQFDDKFQIWTYFLDELRRCRDVLLSLFHFAYFVSILMIAAALVMLFLPIVICLRCMKCLLFV